jgi:hypothetical protein
LVCIFAPFATFAVIANNVSVISFFLIVYPFIYYAKIDTSKPFLFWDFRYITMNYRYSFVALGKEPLGTIGTFKGAEELDITPR